MDHIRGPPPSVLKRQSPAQKAAGATTRFLHVSGIDPSAFAALAAEFEQFGPLEDIDGLDLCVEKRFCWVRYKSVSSAVAAMEGLSERACAAVGGRCLHLSYAEASYPPPIPATAILPSESSGVPGLMVIPDFIGIDEEEFWLSGLCAPDSHHWQHEISRRVQHYGYTFDYETLTLRNTAPSFTHECLALALRCEAHRKQQQEEEVLPIDSDYFTQLTINEYLPGQGISSHIDNVECFGDSIYIISIGSGITMLMSENGDPSRSGGRDIKDSRLAGNRPEQTAHCYTEAEDEIDQRQKRHIWLPRRSLLVLEGAARYQWCHGIAPRKNDQLDRIGVVSRGRRVSLTFRKATSVDGLETAVLTSSSSKEIVEEPTNANSVEAVKQARKEETKRNIERKKEKKRLAAADKARMRDLHVQAGDRIQERKKVPSSIPLSEEARREMQSDTYAPLGLERAHVFDVYDQIALHWHHTRGIRKVYWHRVKEFLDNLPKGTLIADVGSGDGKYFGVNPGIVSIGCDRSEELLKVSWSVEFETLSCDAVKLPYRDDCFDAAICIAVMHHLATVPRRLSLLRELLRIITLGGFAVVQAWAQEQGETSKRTFDAQDVLVPWQLQSTFTTSKQEDLDEQSAAGTVELRNTIPGNNTTKIYQRYCHVYKEGELELLVSQIPGAEVVETGWDKGNWFVKIRKQERIL